MASTAMRPSGVVESITSHDDFAAGRELGDASIDAAVDRVRDEISPTADERFKVVDNKGHIVETTTRERFAEQGLASASIMGTVRVIGGAMIGLAVLVVVLDEIFTINSIANSSGPFSGVIDSLEGTGVAALSLLVIGLLVAAANRVMGFFGGGGF